MPAFELTGKLISVFETQSFSGSNFKKREFVIETNETYPQKILFQLVQDKCSLLDSHSIGDVITVFFNVKGRDWTDVKTGQIKYFISLEAWRLRTEKKIEQEIQSSPGDDLFNDENLNVKNNEEDGSPLESGDPADDLPF